MTRKVKAHPTVMKRICHQWSLLELLFAGVGELVPVMVGKGGTLAVPDGSMLATMATPCVLPASIEHIDPRPHRPRVKTKPESPTFFTGRAGYYDSIDSPKTAIYHSQRVLKNLHLLPLRVFAKDALPRLQTVGKSKENMSGLLSMRLTTSRYRRVTGLLS